MTRVPARTAKIAAGQASAAKAKGKPAARARAPGAAARSTAVSRCILVDGREQWVELDLAESPLSWLAQRRGKDGATLIDAAQFMAGERLRLDFTRAGLTPRVTTRWEESSGGAGLSAGGAMFSDMVMAAKGRLDRALRAVGPELSGVLLDICCFLKGLEQVEQDRAWPPRTAKVVLGLALHRLAAHYGLSCSATGADRSVTRAWREQATPQT